MIAPNLSSHAPPRASVLQALAALPSGAMRRAVLNEVVTRRSRWRAARVFDAIVRAAAQRAPDALSVATDAALWVIEARAPATLAEDPTHAARLDALDAMREAAIEDGHFALASMLAEGRAARALSPHASLAEVAFSAEGPLPLAPHLPNDRGINLLTLERLRLHPDPRMIRRLLHAPAPRRLLVARDVVRIAARRPSTEEIVREVCRAPHWMRLSAVREALADNPFTPASIAAPLVPTLGTGALVRLRDEGSAHPVLAEAARAFLALRDRG